MTCVFMYMLVLFGYIIFLKGIDKFYVDNRFNRVWRKRCCHLNIWFFYGYKYCLHFEKEFIVALLCIDTSPWYVSKPQVGGVTTLDRDRSGPRIRRYIYNFYSRPSPAQPVSTFVLYLYENLLLSWWLCVFRWKCLYSSSNEVMQHWTWFNYESSRIYLSVRLFFVLFCNSKEKVSSFLKIFKVKLWVWFYFSETKRNNKVLYFGYNYSTLKTYGKYNSHKKAKWIFNAHVSDIFDILFFWFW